MVQILQKCLRTVGRWTQFWLPIDVANEKWTQSIPWCIQNDGLQYKKLRKMYKYLSASRSSILTKNVEKHQVSTHIIPQFPMVEQTVKQTNMYRLDVFRSVPDSYVRLLAQIFCIKLKHTLITNYYGWWNMDLKVRCWRKASLEWKQKSSWRLKKCTTQNIKCDDHAHCVLQLQWVCALWVQS